MASTRQPDAITVHIGIVTYNSADDIAACIEAVQRQTYPHLRVTVLDNASQDNTVEWLKTHLAAEQIMLNTINRGFAGGHNQIIATIGEAHYLALNPDVIMEADYIENLLNTIQQHQAGWGIGKLYLGQTAPHHFYSVGHALLRDGYAFNIARNTLDDGSYNGERPIFGASGAAALYTCQLIQTIGFPFFDETLFTYGEDVDLDWRAQLAGFSCWYSPDAVAYHRGGKMDQNLQMMAIANRYLSAIKNACPGHLMTGIIPFMIVHCLFRLILTPRAGYRMTKRIICYAPDMWKKRQPASRCSELEDWFRWSQQQLGEHRSIRERLKAFRSNQKRG